MKKDKSFSTIESYYKFVLKYIDLKLAEFYEATKHHQSDNVLGWQLKKYTDKAIKYKTDADILLMEIKNSTYLYSISKTESPSTNVFIPLEHIIETFKLSDFESFCLYLSIGIELDPSFEKIIRFFNESLNSPYPTLGLALKIFSDNEEHYLKTRLKTNRYSKIFKYFYIDSYSNNRSQPLIGIPLKLDGNIVEFILNFDNYQIKNDFMHIYFPNDYKKESQFKSIENKLKKFVEYNYENQLNKNLLFFLHGPSGIGKHTIVYNFCNHYNQAALLVDCKKLSFDETGHIQINKLCREAILQRAALIFENFDALTSMVNNKNNSIYVEDLLNAISKFSKISFAFSTNPWHPQFEFNHFSIIDINIEIPNDINRHKIWLEKSANLPISSNVNLMDLSNKFKFTPNQVEKALHDAHNMMIWNNESKISEKLIYKANYHQLSNNLKERSERIESNYTWKDLVLPNEQSSQLKEACDHISFKHIVFSKWGFGEKMTYGTGLGLLFTGPPGTGKTLAAQVVANTLNLEIYRVDLSQVISKYIGETEKNLKVIFDEAATSNAILLFDEADAIFSKRTDVKDSHDKYSNVQTSFLLQKIEAYEGLSILTSNLIANIDEAFIRRFSFVIHFPFPTKEYRFEIWKNIFPSETPLSSNIDFQYLANTFDLSGGNIKNIAINAAFLAASKDKSIEMKDILISLSNEISKTGKSILPSDFGEYAYLVSI